MSTISAAPSIGIESLTLNVIQEIHVRAPLGETFATLLKQIGPENETPDGTPIPMKLEAWPGGRWFRDLGNNNGHNWGHVQAIKRPTLLEFSGPLMMSFAAINNVQYRLSEVDGGTLIKFHHYGFGFIPEDYKSGMPDGWKSMNDRVKKAAES